MGLSKWLFPKKSKVKSGFDIDGYLIEEAKKKRIRKGKRMLRDQERSRIGKDLAQVREVLSHNDIGREKERNGVDSTNNLRGNRGSS